MFSQNAYMEAATPVSQNVTVFGDRASSEVIRLINEALRWFLAPVQSDWCPYKRKFGHKE